MPIALLGTVLLAVPASGQEWAEKMFSVTSHNFGTVAKGSKTEFRFVYRNLYEEDVHVSSVRTSCGCTQPAITKKLIETHETGEIVAAFNTSELFLVNMVQHSLLRLINRSMLKFSCELQEIFEEMSHSNLHQSI